MGAMVRSEAGMLRIMDCASMRKHNAEQCCGIEVDCSTLPIEVTNNDHADALRLCAEVLAPLRVGPAPEDPDEVDKVVVSRAWSGQALATLPVDPNNSVADLHAKIAESVGGSDA